MMVKVGDKIYDSNVEPIMVILSDSDKENISNMAPNRTMYCSYPDSCDADTIFEWMKI